MAAPCKPRIRDIAILGFAYFATYFGAGNLIFPPLLGLNSGSSFFSGLVGLTLSGVFLPIFTLIVIGLNGNVHAITDHVGKYTYNILLAALMLVCTFVSIPRTCATAIQLGIQGNIPAAPFIPLVILYFLISFFFSLDKNRVMDRMGKYLTPLLALILVIISVLGIIHPLGTPGAPSVPQPFVNAFLGGYNTGDVLVSFIMASVFITAIANKGYTEIKQRNHCLIACGLIAFILLFIIYGALLYMGACVSQDYPQTIGRADLLVAIIRRIGTAVMIPHGYRRHSSLPDHRHWADCCRSRIYQPGLPPHFLRKSCRGMLPSVRTDRIAWRGRDCNIYWMDFRRMLPAMSGPSGTGHLFPHSS